MSTAVRALLLAALLTLAPLAIGVAVAGDPTPAPAVRPYVATSLEDFDTARAVVRRGAFCDRLPAAASRAALGARSAVTAYGNGQDVPALPGLPGGEVSHEFGCVFAPADVAADSAAQAGAVQAKAWVFAPPVDAARAQALAAADTGSPAAGCTPRTDAPAYGTPSAALLCATDAARTATYRGLFGDAWLGCSLTLPVAVAEDELLERAGTWCVSVARAASVSAP